jgi:phenylpropionate dioxygenase-like ring-hydroxylating dioxygenase large terminal subunit
MRVVEEMNPRAVMDTERQAEHETGALRPTLPAGDYYSPEVFELERARIFHRYWFCIGREEEVAKSGDFIAREVADESILVVRDETGRLGAFYNVCRHRGTRLCDGEGTAGKAIVCPYHSWSYALDGRLIGTPNVPEMPGFDRAQFGLRPVGLETWEGFVFVNLAGVDSAAPLSPGDRAMREPEPLARQRDEWTGYARYHLARLRTAHRSAYEVAANWKIIHENYNECLHCPRVHPELVKLIPAYRRGALVESDDIWGNRLIEGATSFTRTGRSPLPVFPDLTDDEKGRYNGMTIFPNLLLDCLPDNVLYTILWPAAPERTRVTCGLLVEASTMERPDFDPADVVEFHDLVNRQDWGVCERAQLGQRSRGYGRGVYPPQDEYVYKFDQRYLRARDKASE